MSTRHRLPAPTGHDRVSTLISDETHAATQMHGRLEGIGNATGETSTVVA